MSDIISAMDMTIFPIIGLAIFVGIFIVVVVRAVAVSPADAHQAAAIPLDDENVTAPGAKR